MKNKFETIMGKTQDKLESINRRSLRYGSWSFLMVVIVVVTAIVLNLLVGKLQSDNIINMKFDLTSEKIYSIGDETKEILNKLEKDVEIYGLLDIGDINSNINLKFIKEVLSQYEKQHVKVQYIDPDKNPGLIKDIDPSGLKGIQRGDFVVKCGNKLRRIGINEMFGAEYNEQSQQETGTFVGEQSFTGAIKYVTSDKTPAVYFTEGHSEGKLETEYSNLKKQLETNNYEVKSINLLTQDSIPKDAEILMVVSPEADLSVHEKGKLREYLTNGGKAVFLFDPLEKNVVFTEFEDLLKDFNVGLNYDKVKENDKSRYKGTQYAVYLEVPESPVISLNYDLLLAYSRSINILKNQKENVTVTPLARTSKSAVGEQIDKSRGNNLAGPLDIGVAAEYKVGSANSRILVMGNAYFVSDEASKTYDYFFPQANNFFILSLDWLMDKKDEVIVNPKRIDTQMMTMSSEAQEIVISIILVFVFPLAILGSGLFIWVRRRHL